MELGMPEGYDVTVDELRAHASRLDALRDQLNTAVDAGRQVTLGGEAYGVICSFFVPIVQAVSQPGLDALTEAATSMSNTANSVRDTSTTYENTEQANTQPFQGGA
jgi:uncharacterized protein YukE